MEVELRPITAKHPTWYDYKMAIAGTLMDYNMYLRMKGTKRSIVTILRNNVQYNTPEAIVVAIPKKEVKWKEFYLNDLPKIIKKGAGKTMTSYGLDGNQKDALELAIVSMTYHTTHWMSKMKYCQRAVILESDMSPDRKKHLMEEFERCKDKVDKLRKAKKEIQTMIGVPGVSSEVVELDKDQTGLLLGKAIREVADNRSKSDSDLINGVPLKPSNRYDNW